MLWTQNLDTNPSWALPDERNIHPAYTDCLFSGMILAGWVNPSSNASRVSFNPILRRYRVVVFGFLWGKMDWITDTDFPFL